MDIDLYLTPSEIQNSERKEDKLKKKYNSGFSTYFNKKDQKVKEIKFEMVDNM